MQFSIDSLITQRGLEGIKHPSGLVFLQGGRDDGFVSQGDSEGCN